MRFQFFTIPVFDPEPASQTLNTFLASHVVLRVEREVVSDPMGSVWAVCVAYLEPGEAPKTGSSPKKGRIDYRDVLSEADFAVFAKLRDLRKTLSETQGVPAYTLFTNEHLAAMVTQRATSKATLAKVDGIGPARIDKYAEAFLRVLREAFGSSGVDEDAEA